VAFIGVTRGKLNKWNLAEFFLLLSVHGHWTGLTRRPGRLWPSDMAPVLQYGSRPFSDFLAKILGVNTSAFACNTQFYFTHFPLLLRKSWLVCITSLFAVAEWLEYLLTAQMTCVRFPSVTFFLNHHVMVVIGTVTFHLLSSFCIFCLLSRPDWQLVILKS
jgi:hypothetical protein